MTLSTEAIFDLQACKTLHICFVIGMKDFIHLSDFYDEHFPVLWNIFYLLVSSSIMLIVHLRGQQNSLQKRLNFVLILLLQPRSTNSSRTKCTQMLPSQTKELCIQRTRVIGSCTHKSSFLLTKWLWADPKNFYLCLYFEGPQHRCPRLLDHFQCLRCWALIGQALRARQEVPNALSLHSQVRGQRDERRAYHALLHVTLHAHCTCNRNMQSC